MLLRIIYGRVSTTLQFSRFPQKCPPCVDERRDVTAYNQHEAMKVYLSITDMKNYIQLFLYKFGVYNYKIS